MDATEHLEELLDEGREVSPDLCLRIYAALGSIYVENDPDAMRDAYLRASDYIPGLRDPVSCARTCLRCAEDLYDAEFPDDSAAKYADEVIMLHGGAIYAVGTPSEVITAENLKVVYGVDSAVIDDEGRPHVILRDAVPMDEDLA